jgi:hypothetical protein
MSIFSNIEPNPSHEEGHLTESQLRIIIPPSPPVPMDSDGHVQASSAAVKGDFLATLM